MEISEDSLVKQQATRSEAMASRHALLLQGDSRYRIRKGVSWLMAALVGACTVFGVAILWIILGYVIVRGLPALNLDFFTQRPLPYGEVGGGVAPAILGSLYLIVVACVIGLPLAVLTAIYLAEYAHGRFGDAVRFVIDLLAGLPSIVVGVFVWTLIVINTGSFSGLAGAVALAIIMIPIVARTVEAILNLVPNSMREASLALGVPTWKTIVRVVLPAAKSGIITGVVLAMARAGGETAPLLMTTLGNQFFNFDLMQPIAALPVQIYNYAVVLIALIGALSLLARWAVRSQKLQ
jgi:phosphate transport system permease protein